MTTTLVEPILDWGFSNETEDEFDWEFLTDALTELMDKLCIRNIHKGYWHCEVSGFGWRSQSGEKNFKADTGTKFLQEILPNTDCHFKIFREGNILRIQNYHHDSPVGNENYYIRPMSWKEAENYIDYH